MFYSHELLTNRQYGVATIWLVATLGSKSTLKKVTRKAILDVDIPKACDTIVDPETPLALRLQASLLYGVSRVHSQQTNYVLTDMQSFREKMRGMTQIMKDLEIDQDVGRTRPEQLNLPEDSAFIPELDLNFDLSAFDLPSASASSRASSIFSPVSGGSRQSNLDLEEEVGFALDIPSVDTPDDYGDFSANLGGPSSTGTLGVKKTAAAFARNEDAVIIDNDFDILEDGSLVMVSRPPTVARSNAGDGRAISESGFSARVRAEHEAGLENDEGILPAIDDDPMILMGDDDEVRLPSAEPFPPAVRPQPLQPIASPTHRTESVSSESAVAPQRQTRGPRQVRRDQRTELQNNEIGQWNNNYLRNMNQLARTKDQKRSAAQAKKNAAFWILGQGIGGVQTNFGTDREPHPLAMFSGQGLLEALLGPQPQRSPTSSKRSRSMSPQSEERRRVRARTEEGADVARGVVDDGPVMGFDDDGILVQGDDANPESEVGRRADSSIPDIPSDLPWNRSASRQGSARPFGSGGYGISSSVGGAGSAMRSRAGSALGGRRSRMHSASPLHGKGHARLSALGLDDLKDLAENERARLAEEEEDIMDIDDFEQYASGAGMGTQQTTDGQWMRTTLENEAQNFLGFVETQLKEKGREVIAMDELLPPEENSAVVGAQALLHVLALVTKGLLSVQQEEAFGDIELSIVAVMEVVEHEDVNEEGEDDQEQAEADSQAAETEAEQEQAGDVMNVEDVDDERDGADEL